MLRFGMGVGITLGASGLLEDLEDDSGKTRPRTSGENIGEPSTVDEVPLGPLVAKVLSTLCGIINLVVSSSRKVVIRWSTSFEGYDHSTKFTAFRGITCSRLN